jgi:hypothetical protein
MIDYHFAQSADNYKIANLKACVKIKNNTDMNYIFKNIIVLQY